MPTWLIDPSNAFYLALFVFVVIAVMVWARNRTRGSLARAGVAVALLVLFFVFDQLFESPREGTVQAVLEISEAINEQNWDRFQGGLSDDFTYKGLDKRKFTETVRDAATAFAPRTAAWEFKAPDDMQPAGPNEFLLQFEGKAESGGRQFPAHFVGTFRKGPDGRWRLKTFTAYDYIQKRQPIDIPGISNIRG
jgi:hypothetical protein